MNIKPFKQGHYFIKLAVGNTDLILQSHLDEDIDFIDSVIKFFERSLTRESSRCRKMKLIPIL